MVAEFEKFKHGREHVGVLELREDGEQHTAVGLPHTEGFQIFLPVVVLHPQECPDPTARLRCSLLLLLELPH